MLKRLREARLHWIYGLMFLFSLVSALLSYINSAFLQQFIDTQFVGTVFTVAYLLTFFALGDIRLFIASFNPRKSFRILLSLAFICLVGLSFVSEMWTVLSLFVIYIMIMNLAYVNLDIIIEHYSKDKETGRIRGLVLTFANFAFVFAPVFAGTLVDSFGFWLPYLIAALLIVPIYLSFFINFKDIDTYYQKKKVKPVSDIASILKLKKNPSIQLIFWTYLGLNVFYSIMVIYVPLHLLNLGFEWTQIGLLLTIALLPFVLVQYLAGWLADRYLGEQEMLIIGFILMGLATMGLFFVSSFLFWVILMFISRIGAALVEILCDSYFYKQVNEEDVTLFSLFRRASPLGYALGPLIISVFLQFYDLQYIFLFLGFALILATFLPYNLKDTK